MTTLDLDENRSQYQIRAYLPGQIWINDRLFIHSLIVAPSTLIEHWAPQRVEELSTSSFLPIIALKPDILLIGTGTEIVFLHTELYGELINYGIGVEFMDTGAACRTFNALSAEQRNVAAALIIR